MTVDTTQRLHWTQRVALVRHSLHAARRTGDFAFFKTLQAHALIDGTDHVAILHSLLGDNADSVFSTLDNLNAGIAYVHQDAFKAVYDSAKSTMYKADNTPSSRRSLLRVDIAQQRDMADHAIDKTTNSAINLIEAQPSHCRDAVTNAWIMGTTIIADAVCVCLNQMEEIEKCMDDFIRLEYSWSAIQNSVDAAISALRGIFNLMAIPNSSGGSRNHSITSSAGSEVSSTSGTGRGRTPSSASALSLIKRAFSHSRGMPPLKLSHTSFVPSPESNPKGFRLSMSAACPTRIPSFPNLPPTQLPTIPPTPSAHGTPFNETMSPFKETKDYFSLNLEKESDDADKTEPVNQEDMMQYESLDPLCTPSYEIKIPTPLTMRRRSDAFSIDAPSGITA